MHEVEPMIPHSKQAKAHDVSFIMKVANGGGLEALLIDAAGRLISKDYAQRVSSHEAGHFLVAYLIGLLPKKYIISSVDAFQR